MLFSNPITSMILDGLGVDEDGRAKIRSALDRMIRGRAAASPVAVLTALVNIGWGYKAGPPLADVR